MNEINVTSGGPIEGTFRIDLSPGPGVYEFRGARGTGKTTLISSIDWLTGHKVDVTLHDGAVSGKVEGFGVVAPIGGRKRRKGEFGLDTIDAEKFSLTDLIDPPGKTPEVRDAHAIKALAVLSETKADPALYYSLFDGQAYFDVLGIAKTDDPVLLATRVKQACDKEARGRQNTAEAEEGHAAPLEHIPDGLDMGQSSDLEELGAIRDNARDWLKQMQDDRTTGIEKKAKAEQAAERLETLGAEYAGPTVEEAMEVEREAAIEYEEALRNVEAGRAKLEAANRTRNAATAAYELASQTIETAKQHAEAVSALEDTANQTYALVSAGAIADAQVAVTNASGAYDQGIQIRDVKQNQGKAKAHREAAEAAEKAGEEARNKAGLVFDILAQSLHTSHLEIRTVDGNPRLFVQHPKRGRTAFDRTNGISQGERVDFTLRELLPHIESPGLLPIPQTCWQDLQPSDRRNLHKLAVEKGLYLFGAQITDSDLHVVYLGDELDGESS